MKQTTRQAIILSAMLLGLIVALLVLFFFFYEPELALRAQQNKPEPNPQELDRLVKLAEMDRFDLTDTLRLARLLQQNNRTDDELALFQRLENRYPTMPTIRLWHAERLQQYAKWNEADATYSALLELMKNKKQMQKNVSGRFWRAQDKDIILAKYAGEISDRLAPVTLDELYRKLAENAMAAATAATGTHAEAWMEKSKILFEASLKENPANQGARGAYANLLLQAGKADESLRQYQNLLETNPENTGWLISASLAAAADRNFNQAEIYLRRALAIENKEEWRLELARIMSWGGKHDSALAEIQLLIEQFSNNPEYRLEHATFLLNARRHSEYLAQTARLSAANPMNFELRLNRIRAMISLGAYPEAVNEASALIALDPQHREAATLRAQAMLWHGDYSAAQTAWQELVRQAPDDMVARKRLAQTFLWDKRYDDALAIFRTLNPDAMDDEETSQGYAEAVAAKDTPTATDAAMIRAMHQEMKRKKNTAWPVPLLSAMGRALRSIGDKETAVELFRAATQRAETNLKLRLELADLLQDIGLREEADREYRRITNTDTKDRRP